LPEDRLWLGGGDAESLASAGGRVVVFDISPTAIEWCRGRFPASSVTYVTTDLFAVPRARRGAFDFVLESFPLQGIRSDMRQRAMRCIVLSGRLWAGFFCLFRGKPSRKIERTAESGTERF